MKKIYLGIVAALCSVSAMAESSSIICIWNINPRQHQSFIVDFDQAQNKVFFNSTEATDPSVTDTEVKFSLHFKIKDPITQADREVVWPHVINRATGIATVDQTDTHGKRQLQCGKLSNGGF